MDYSQEQIHLQKFFNYYNSLASQGYVYAQSYIAEAYFWGWGVQADYEQFIQLDTKAAKNGSRPSGRRMFLYYLMKGNIDAAASLYMKADVIPAAGYIFDAKKFKEIYGGCKNIESFVKLYAEGADVNDEDKQYYVDSRRKESKLFLAMGYIFGFGAFRDYNKAESCLREIDYPDGLYDSKNDAANYYLSMYEQGCEIDLDLLEEIKKKSYFKNMILDEITVGSFIRHAVRLGMLGYAEASYGLGYRMKTKKTDNEDKREKWFYHDDQDALYWFAYSAEIPGYCHSTCDAISISSDLKGNGFNYEYAKRVCYYALNNTNYDSSEDNSESTLDYDSITKHCAAKGLTYLATVCTDQNEKLSMAQNALDEFMRQGREEPREIDAKHICILYCDVYKDYSQASIWLKKAQEQGGDMEEYVSKCKRLGATSLVSRLFGRK